MDGRTGGCSFWKETYFWLDNIKTFIVRHSFLNKNALFWPIVVDISSPCVLLYPGRKGAKVAMADNDKNLVWIWRVEHVRRGWWDQSEGHVYAWSLRLFANCDKHDARGDLIRCMCLLDTRVILNCARMKPKFMCCSLCTNHWNWYNVCIATNL